MSAAEAAIAVLGLLVGVLGHQLHRSRGRARALAIANRRLHREVLALRPQRRVGDLAYGSPTSSSRLAYGGPISPAPFPAPHRWDCKCRSCVTRRRDAYSARREAMAAANYRDPELPSPTDPAKPYALPSALLAELDDLEEGGDGVVQVRDLDGEPAQREVDVDVLGLADPHHQARVTVGGRVDELELRTGSPEQLGDTGIGEGHVGLGAPEHSHEASPSVGRSPGGAGTVGGAPGRSTPGAGVPTVGEPTDSGGGPSASPVPVEAPAGDGEAPAPSSAAAPAFGRLDVGPFPDGIRAGWVCPCGEGGYLLAGASQDDVAGYEADQFDHAEACPQSGAL